MMDSQHERVESRGVADSSTLVPIRSPYIQDPSFYFPDGSMVLLVENTLFKVHTSVLGREAAAFRDLPNSAEPATRESGLVQIHLSGDIVFRVPDMKAEHFRHFLFMFYGLPTNQKYRALMSNTNDFHSVLSLNFHWYIYLDVAEVAGRFIAPSLETWAHNRLRAVASTACEELSRYSLPMEYRLRALLYAKRVHDDELLADVRHATQLHFTWVSKNSPILSTIKTDALDSARERLFWLFHYPGIQQIDHSLFGFAFCGLLGLGHEVWMNAASLSRDDRVMFLFAQVHLTPLPIPALGLEWLDTLTMQNQKGEGTSIECCSECNFYVNWEAAFGGTYRQQLCAATPPLSGISQLVILPYQRLLFRGSLMEEHPSECKSSCHIKMIGFVDKCIEDTYARLATFCRNVE